MPPNNPCKLPEDVRRKLEEATRFHQERSVRISAEFGAWHNATRPPLVPILSRLGRESVAKGERDLSLFEASLNEAFFSGWTACELFNANGRPLERLARSGGTASQTTNPTAKGPLL